MVSQGDTFLGGGQVHGVDHLWIVINDPAQHGGRALFVNVTTMRADAETTCILAKAEHPFIKHESYVRYISARDADVASLDVLINAKKLRPQPPASAALLAKLRAGAVASPLLPPEKRALL